MSATAAATTRARSSYCSSRAVLVCQTSRTPPTTAVPTRMPTTDHSNQDANDRMVTITSG